MRLLDGPRRGPSASPGPRRRAGCARRARAEPPTPQRPPASDIRLRRLARAFELDAVDVELLLVALAPDLDPRFERLYGYLHDDVSRRRASAGLALELAGPAPAWQVAPTAPGSGRTAPLVADGLVLVEEPIGPS